MSKANIKKPIIAIAIPLATGGLAALITKNAMTEFNSLNKPPLSPPAWAFPVVWTVLYILMGVASYLVLTCGKRPDRIRTALYVYLLQLFVNFLWSILFFSLKLYFFAFLWLVLLWVLVLTTLTLFYDLKQAAGWLMVPYIVWVTIAGYLNFGVYLLN